MTNPTRQEQAAFEDKLIEWAERISKKSMSEFINIPTWEDLIPRKEVDRLIYEIITDPQVIEETFRQDQEAEDAPVPDKVQDILTNTVWFLPT